MTTLLKAIDIFGSKFSYTINQKRTMTTVLGGILTITGTFAFVLIFILLGKDFIFQRNPKETSSKYIDSEIKKVNLGDHKLTIAFSLKKDLINTQLDLQGGFLWSKFFQISSEHDPNNLNQNLQKYNEIPIIKCNELPYQTSQIFSEDYYCLNLNNTFLGQSETGNYSLQLNINFCEKNTSDDHSLCRTIPNLQKKFKENNNKPYCLNIHYPVLYHDSRDRNQPGKVAYTSVEFPFGYNLQRTDYLYMHNSVTNDDIGWWFEDVQETNYFTIESTLVNYQFKSNEDLFLPNSSSQLYRLNLMINPSTQVYYRSYMKFQDVLAITLSLSRFIFIAFEALSAIINAALIKYYVFHQMFDWSTIPSLKTSSHTSFSMQNTSSNNLIANRKQDSVNLFGYPIVYNDDIIDPYGNNKRKANDTLKKNSITKWYAVKRAFGKEFICGAQKKIINLCDNGMKIVKETMDLDYYIKMIFNVILIKKKYGVQTTKKKMNLFDINEIYYFFPKKSEVNGENTKLSTSKPEMNQKILTRQNTHLVINNSNSILSFRNK